MVIIHEHAFLHLLLEWTMCSCWIYCSFFDLGKDCLSLPSSLGSYVLLEILKLGNCLNKSVPSVVDSVDFG